MKIVKSETIVTRSPTGDPLDAGTVEILRALIAEHGSRRLVVPLGVSVTALERAASGGRVLRGTRLLIASGLQRMREAGELPDPGREK